jgi:glycopeptide antibiotics resistance protein
MAHRLAVVNGPLSYLLFAALLIALTVYSVIRASRSSHRGRALVIVALGVWLAATGYMTIRPRPERAARLNLIPFVGIGHDTAFDVLVNIGIFIPLGLLLAALGWRALVAVGLALAISLSIETTQYITNFGRTADIDDVITDTLGASIGWVIAWAIAKPRTRAQR